MKKISVPFMIICMTMVCSKPLTAQLGVGTTTPDPSAKLDVDSKDQGVLLPRMSFTDMDNIANPATGLLVYCTTCTPAGLHHYNGSNWVPITDLTYQSSNFSAGDNLGNHTATQTIKIRNNKIVGGTSSTDGTDGISIAQDGGVTFGNGVAVKAFSNNPNLGASNDSIATQKAVKDYVDNFGGLISDNVSPHINVNGGNSNFNSIVRSGAANLAIGNMALGFSALNQLTDADWNLAVGNYAGAAVTTSGSNTYVGNSAGQYRTGASNVALGHSAFAGSPTVATGSSNVMIGGTAGQNLVGDASTYIGHGAGVGSTAGSYSIKVGRWAGAYNNGSNNVIVGTDASFRDSSGNSNVVLGHESGRNMGGSGHVLIGYQAGYNAKGSNRLYVENSNSDIPLIGGNFANDKVGINVDIGTLGANAATLNVGGDLKLGDGVAVKAFSNNPNLGGSNASNDSVATQSAVRSFINNNRGLIDEGNGNLHGGGNLQNVTTGYGNLALGGSTLGAVSTGIYNTSVGAVSGIAVTTGNYNTFMGVSSGRLTGTGSNNVAMGMNTLFWNGSGSGNTAIGAGAGNKMTSASHNALFGYQTGTYNLNSFNTMIGAQAGLNSNTTASVYLGFQAGYHDTIGGQHLWIANTGDVNLTPLVGGDFTKKKVGINMHIDSLNQDDRATFQVGGSIQLQNGATVQEFSIDTTMTGNSHNAVPTERAVKYYVDNHGGLIQDAASPTPNVYGDNSNFGTLTSNAGGNTALGYQALGSLTDGQNNTAIGPLAGNAQTTSGSNAFVGSEAGRYRTGHSNIALGHNAFIGSALTQSGDENVMIGKNTGDLLDANQSVYIGNNAGFQSTGGSGSVKIGYRSGYGRNGYGNVMIGFDAAGGNPGVAGDAGTLNTFIGTGAGYNSKGNSNVMVGRNAGFHNNGSSNVLLGAAAGVNNSGDHKLYIETSNTNSPLIGGDFSQNKLGINVDVTTLNSSSATLTVGGDLQLGNGAKVKAFSTRNDLAGANASDDSVATQKAVKTYVDSKTTTPIREVGGSGPINVDDHTVVFDGGGSLTLTLPDLNTVPDGKMYYIINLGSSIQLNTFSSQQINNSSAESMQSNQTIVLQKWNNTKWLKVMHVNNQ